MNYIFEINMKIKNFEVPELRNSVGWDRRDEDYPSFFEKCNYWIGVRNKEKNFIGFGYMCSMGLEHGYLEDVIVHPDYQKAGIGYEIVTRLVNESQKHNIKIVTATFDTSKKNFYKKCGTKIGFSGLRTN